jgi:hypothetical protein
LLLLLPLPLFSLHTNTHTHTPASAIRFANSWTPLLPVREKMICSLNIYLINNKENRQTKVSKKKIVSQSIIVYFWL